MRTLLCFYAIFTNGKSIVTSLMDKALPKGGQLLKERTAFKGENSFFFKELTSILKEGKNIRQSCFP